MNDTICDMTRFFTVDMSLILQSLKLKMIIPLTTLSNRTGLGINLILGLMAVAVILVTTVVFFMMKPRRKQDESISEELPSDGTTQEIDSQIARQQDGIQNETQPVPVIEETDDQAPAGIFSSIRNGLSKTRKAFSAGVDKLFASGGRLDDDMLENLEEMLITSDVGVDTSMKLISTLTTKSTGISNAKDLKQAMKEEIFKLIDVPKISLTDGRHKPHVIMVVGVNGVGKTTTIGKLASRFVKEGKKVLIVAADTFRAAASEQLAVWAERSGADIVRHKDNSDPAAVAFDGIEAALSRDVDIVMIDTAGRLHTKKNLMEELKKIKRTVSAKIPDAPHDTLMVVDATTGQNALQQAKLFNEAIGITAIALTKLDGTAKGGIVIGICHTLKIPLTYVGVGEQVEDLQDFDPREFADALM